MEFSRFGNPPFVAGSSQCGAGMVAGEGFGYVAPGEAEGDMRRLISTGSPFEEAFAYSRAVVKGDWCFVAGTTGYDYASMTMPAAAVDQARAAFATIARTLAEAGFALRDVVRVQYTITDPALRREIAPALREALGEVRPAATMVVAGLTEPEMLVEIEVTAFRG
jgi:enamine deaminase RidA (YjgF/YER057c/UK114 family)